MDEETHLSLLETKIDDMTVGDSLKLQLYVLAGLAGTAAVYIGGTAAYVKFSNWRFQRKLKKAAESDDNQSDDE